MNEIIFGIGYDFYIIDKYYTFYEIDGYYHEDNKVLPRPLRVIGKPCGAKIYKKHTYFHCRSMLK